MNPDEWASLGGFVAYMEAREKEKRYFAYHEAGHALLNELVGFQVKWIDLDYAGGAKTQTADHDLNKMTDDELGLRTAVVYAGMMAEDRYRRGLGEGPIGEGHITFERGWRPDREDLGSIRNVTGQERFEQIETKGRKLAQEVLDAAWPTVVELAEALHTYGRLDGWRVRKITGPTVVRLSALVR